MQLDELLDRLDKVRRTWGGYSAQCPAHTDRVNSLSVRMDGDRLLVKCHAMCDTRDVMTALGLRMGDLFYDSQSESIYHREPDVKYPYRDEKSELLYWICRWETPLGKQIRPMKPDGSWGIEGVRRVLYRLPELTKAKETQRFACGVWSNTYIVEGEKDADALVSRGVCATTPPFGAGKWKASYVKYFRDLRVVVIADKDSTGLDGHSPGLRHAREIAESLEGIAKSVRIVQSKAGKDVTDHLEAGYSLEELEEI